MSSPDFDMEVQSESELKSLDLSLNDEEKIASLMRNLEEEFNLSNESTLKESLAGDSEGASRAHRFLFDKAVSEQDPVRLQDLTLAHLALDLKYNKTARFKSVFGDDQSLEVPGTDIKYFFKETHLTRFYVDQMLASNSKLVKSQKGLEETSKLVVLNEKLKDEFTRFTLMYKKIDPLIQDGGLPQGLTRREVTAIEACQVMVQEYFGVVDEHTLTRNSLKYESGLEVKLDEFKSDDSGTCSEYAAFTHQMMSFAGLQPILVSGGVTEKYTAEHVFEVIRPLENQSKNIFIYDPAITLTVRDSQDPRLTREKPYLVALTESETRSFCDGEDLALKVGEDKRTYFISDPPYAIGKLIL